MLKSILVALEGCPATDAVIALAVQLGQQFQASLGVAEVVDVAQLTQAEALPLGGSAFKHERDKVLVAQARERAAAALQKLSAQAHAAGVSYQLVGIEEHPQRELLVAAQRFDALLISQWPLVEKNREPDPLLTRLLKFSPRPVIAVPNELPEGNAVVIAYDGSLQSTRTLQIFTLLWRPATEVHVVSVQPKVEDAQHQAETAREYLKLHGIEATVHASAGSSPHKTILDAVQQYHAGLLVMGAYGKPSWREFFFGTVTKHILAENSVPLFLYH